jgi:hypothetical protein
MFRAIICAAAAAAFLGLAAPAQAGMLNPGLNGAAISTGLSTAPHATVQDVGWRERRWRRWERRHWRHWRRRHRHCWWTTRWRHYHRYRVRHCVWRRW